MNYFQLLEESGELKTYKKESSQWWILPLIAVGFFLAHVVVFLV